MALPDSPESAYWSSWVCILCQILSCDCYHAPWLFEELEALGVCRRLRTGSPIGGPRFSSGHRPTPCRSSGGASDCTRSPFPGGHPPSAKCLGRTNMSISLSLWFGQIAPPRPPLARSQRQGAGYRGASLGPENPS